MEKLRARRREGETLCPYCHAELMAQDVVVACGGCATVYHSDCLRDELKGCASLGCEVRPELGHAFTWGERGPLQGAVASPGVKPTCCDDDARTGEPIYVCQGCGSIHHVSCLAKSGACCLGHKTVPLLDHRSPAGDVSLLKKSVRVWLLVLLLTIAGFVTRLFYFGTSAGEFFVWVVGIVTLAFVGAYFLKRWLTR